METEGAAGQETGRRAPRLAMASLFGILAITIAWWALALWPSADVPPAWLLRTRQVCFNSGPSGLPGPSGWMLLIGQPIGMVALLMAIAGDSVRLGLRQATESRRGLMGVSLLMAAPLVGLVLTGFRVAGAPGDAEWIAVAEQVVPDSYPRLDRDAPALGLMDQHGDTVRWDRFQGGPVLVTFGFGHCPSICPLMIRNALRVQETFRGEGVEVPVVVVTLDPWRDTPSRLPHLAEQFGIGENAFVLSGPIDEVNRVLDGLEVPRERDAQTGDVVHPSLVYVLDENGTVAYGATGHAPLMEELLRRL